MKTLTALAIAAALVSACATKYQSVGFTGGFTDTQLAPDMFRVSFSGNAATSADRVQDFALLRAAELTLANNFKFFAVVQSADQSRTGTFTTPGSSQTTGTMSSYGNTASCSGTTTYSPPQTTTYYKPGVGLIVRAFPTKPDGIFAFDAEYLVRSLRTKYGIQ